MVWQHQSCQCCIVFVVAIFVIIIHITQVKTQINDRIGGSGSTAAELWRSTRHLDTKRSTVEEPSDGAILRAVVQSMQDYYTRQDLRVRRAKTLNVTKHHVEKRDEEVVCYEDLGCFRDEGPFDYLDMLPLPPDRIQTEFLLYTRRSPEQPESLYQANVTSLYTSAFNRTNPTKMMIHGFGSSCQKVWAIEMRKALLQVDDVNVICVDWAEGAALPNYVQAAANARLVGKQVARLVRTINTLRGTNNTKFHLIGFSLGAHVAGFAGDELRNISRITGLDPAAPLFEGYSEKARLDPSDADFVDVIHSNGDSLLYGGLGAYEPMGHVDYYPNGGKVQGGCSNIFVGAISDLLWYQSRSADGRSLCNHRRAYKFFTDSVMPTCSFLAFECPDYEKFMQGECFPCDPSKRNCGNMGYYADKSLARGKLFLLTRNSEPFCANQFKVIVESSPGLTPTYGGLELTLIGWNQLNETIQLSSEWEQLVPGQPLTRLIFSHPSLVELTSAQIKYTPYKGWITNGLEQWAVDRLTVIDSFRRTYSFCRQGLPLEEGKPTTVFLRNEDCIDNNIHLFPDVLGVPDLKNTRPIQTASGSTINMIYSKNKMSDIEEQSHTVLQSPQLSRSVAMSVEKNPQLQSTDVILNSTKSPNKIYSQAMYFQFFPVPIRSKNLTKPGSLRFREVLKNGVAYNVADEGRIGQMYKKPNSVRGTRYGLKSSSSTIVRLIPSKSPDSVNRLGRQLSTHDGTLRRQAAVVVPDISAQMIFVPNSRTSRVHYIPLRPNRGNSSSRMLSSFAVSRAKSQPMRLFPLRMSGRRPLRMTPAPAAAQNKTGRAIGDSSFTYWL